MAILFYRLFLWLYRCGALVLSPFNDKAKHWLSGRKNVFATLQNFMASEERAIIWFHCASLGEFEQARPLLEQLRANYTSYAILLSFFSPSGYEVRKNYAGADFVTYLPMDSAGNADRFLHLVKPCLVIWVKYEYWYFYLQYIKKQHIPLLLVSGIFRQDQVFFSRWGELHRQMLSCFSHLFVQNKASETLLGTIGLTSNVTVSGDTRFDRVIEIAAGAGTIPLLEEFIAGDPVIVAGSTWEEDEEEMDHFANTHPHLKFIIAPHEIDEEHLKEIEKLFRHSIRYSALIAQQKSNKTKPPAPDDKFPYPNTLIIDNIGMLSQLYQYATIAYVGGGFGNDGVHNVLEAAVYGKPVVYGPVYEKFAEAVELIDAGAAFCVENALELEEVLEALLKNETEYATACQAAVDYVYANGGATQKIRSYIQENRLLTS